MDNYIIRIYRRDPADPQKIAGIAEAVETEKKRAFSTSGELVNILNAVEDRKTVRKKTRLKCRI